jgi:hypothetical protein
MGLKSLTSHNEPEHWTWRSHLMRKWSPVDGNVKARLLGFTEVLMSFQPEATLDNPNPTAYPKVETLAELMGWSRATVLRNRKDAEEYGLVRVVGYRPAFGGGMPLPMYVRSIPPDDSGKVSKMTPCKVSKMRPDTRDTNTRYENLDTSKQQGLKNETLPTITPPLGHRSDVDLESDHSSSTEKSRVHETQERGIAQGLKNETLPDWPEDSIGAEANEGVTTNDPSPWVGSYSGPVPPDGF